VIYGSTVSVKIIAIAAFVAHLKVIATCGEGELSGRLARAGDWIAEVLLRAVKIVPLGSLLFATGWKLNCASLLDGHAIGCPTAQSSPPSTTPRQIQSPAPSLTCPNNSTFTAGRNNFQVSYEGGDGNDFTLTVLP